MDTNPTVSIPRNRRIRNVASVGALLLVTGLVLGACGSDDSDDAGSAATSTTLAVPADVTTTVAPGSSVATGSGEGRSSGGGESGTGGQTGGGESSGGESSGGGESGGGQSGGGQSGGGQTAPAPTITSFTTPEDIDCHNGNFQTFTASWTTTNAVRVTISIDGPGVYNEYAANGEADLPFNCSTPHSFLLTAYGSDGQTATSSVTLAPRNAQPESGGDTEDV